MSFSFTLILYLKMIFSWGLSVATVVGWSSNNWVLIWLMMEASFLFFIGFTSVDLNYGIVELMVKYYLVQVFISLFFVLLAITNLFNLSLGLYFYLIPILMMKLGMVPFHFWLIMILGKLKWDSFFLLVTLLKLLPVLMVYYLNFILSFNYLLILSIVGGNLLGLNNMVVQKLLGYSSLIHLCWLLLSLSFSLNIFTFYFFSYLVLLLILVLLLSKLNVFYVNQLKILSYSLISKTFIFFLVLSLAGFPPFVGFIMKWVVVSLMLSFKMKFLVVIFVGFSLFSVIFYLELFYYLMLMMSISTSWFNRSLVYYNQMFFLMFGFYLLLFFGF